MKRIYQYLVACCITALAICPSDAYAGYSLQLANGTRQTLDSSKEYYLNGSTSQFPFIERNDYATTLIVPTSGTITSVQGNLFSGFSGINASSEPCTISIIKNDTSTVVTNSFAIDQVGSNPFSNTSLNLAVTAGDALQMTLTTPEWASRPVYTNFSVSLYIE